MTEGGPDDAREGSLMWQLTEDPDYGWFRGVWRGSACGAAFYAGSLLAVELFPRSGAATTVSNVLAVLATVILVVLGCSAASRILFLFLQPLSRTSLWRIYFFASSFHDGPLAYGSSALALRNLSTTQFSSEDLVPLVGAQAAPQLLLVTQRLLVSLALLCIGLGIKRVVVKMHTVKSAFSDYVARVERLIFFQEALRALFSRDPFRPRYVSTQPAGQTWWHKIIDDFSGAPAAVTDTPYEEDDRGGRAQPSWLLYAVASCWAAAITALSWLSGGLLFLLCCSRPAADGDATRRARHVAPTLTDGGEAAGVAGPVRDVLTRAAFTRVRQTRFKLPDVAPPSSAASSQRLGRGIGGPLAKRVKGMAERLRAGPSPSGAPHGWPVRDHSAHPSPAPGSSSSASPPPSSFDWAAYAQGPSTFGPAPASVVHVDDPSSIFSGDARDTGSGSAPWGGWLRRRHRRGAARRNEAAAPATRSLDSSPVPSASAGSAAGAVAPAGAGGAGVHTSKRPLMRAVNGRKHARALAFAMFQRLARVITARADASGPAAADALPTATAMVGASAARAEAAEGPRRPRAEDTASPLVTPSQVCVGSAGDGAGSGTAEELGASRAPAKPGRRRLRGDTLHEEEEEEEEEDAADTPGGEGEGGARTQQREPDGGGAPGTGQSVAAGGLDQTREGGPGGGGGSAFGGALPARDDRAEPRRGADAAPAGAGRRTAEPSPGGARPARAHPTSASAAEAARIAESRVAATDYVRGGRLAAPDVVYGAAEPAPIEPTGASAATSRSCAVSTVTTGAVPHGGRADARAAAAPVSAAVPPAAPAAAFVLTERHLHGALRREDAAKLFQMLDFREDGLVDEGEFVLSVLRWHRAWAELAAALSNREHISNGLDIVLNVALGVVMSITTLLLLEIDLERFLVILGTLLLSASFAFGSTAQRAVHSLLFLFLYRPFDVGDRVRIGSNPQTTAAAPPMYVHRIGLLYCAFKTVYNEITYMPNAELATMCIHNNKRSPNAWVHVQVLLSYDCAPEQLVELERCVHYYVRHLSRDWKHEIWLHVGDAQLTSNMLTCNIWLPHHLSWQDASLIFAHKGTLIQYIAAQCQRLGMSFELPPQPVVVSGRINDPPATDEVPPAPVH